MTPIQIKQQIEALLPNAIAIVTGEDGVHFQAQVIAPQFEGLSRVQQQQAVYSALAPWINSGELHALALKTFTPAQWQQQEVS